MRKEIVLALALSLCIGIGMAVDTPTFSYTSYTNRPDNFVMTDFATASGFNSFSASTLANAGGVDEHTTINTLPCVSCSAPDEKSFQQVTMDFFKDGKTVDPAVQETIQSDITVGTVVPQGGIVVPTLNKDGTLSTGKIGEGYDIASLTVGGMAGTPIVNNGVLTGITDDYQRYVFGSVNSYQDDYIAATGADSAGTLANVLTSYTTAQVGSPTMPGDTAYVKFNWNDMRGYRVDVNGVAFSGLPEWTIQNTINYQQVLPADYRNGGYLNMAWP